MWETLAACRDPPEPPPVRYLEYIVRYGGVPGESQHAAYRVNGMAGEVSQSTAAGCIAAAAQCSAHARRGF